MKSGRESKLLRRAEQEND